MQPLLQSAQKLSQLEHSFQESANNDKTQSALKKQLFLLKKVKNAVCGYNLSLKIFWA